MYNSQTLDPGNAYLISSSFYSSSTSYPVAEERMLKN
jgi:hypothetical protein